MTLFVFLNLHYVDKEKMTMFLIRYTGTMITKILLFNDWNHLCQSAEK